MTPPCATPEQIASLRASGLTQEQIARVFGVTRPRISQIETGYYARNPEKAHTRRSRARRA